MKSKIIMLFISFALIICCVSCARVEGSEIAGSDEPETETETETETKTETEPETEAETETETEAKTETETEADEATPYTPPVTVPDETEPIDVLVPLDSAIKTATDEMKSKGWTDIEVIEGEPDSINLWGSLVIEPYQLDENSKLYSVLGKSGNISSVIRIVCDLDNNYAKQVEMYYAAISGREIRGADLKSFLRTRSKPNELLSADDEDMYYYLLG